MLSSIGVDIPDCEPALALVDEKISGREKGTSKKRQVRSVSVFVAVDKEFRGGIIRSDDIALGEDKLMIWDTDGEALGEYKGHITVVPASSTHVSPEYIDVPE